MVTVGLTIGVETSSPVIQRSGLTRMATVTGTTGAILVGMLLGIQIGQESS